MPSADTTTVLPPAADPFGVLTTTTTLPPSVTTTAATQVLTAETVTVLPGPPGPPGGSTGAPRKITGDAVTSPGQAVWATTAAGQTLTIVVAVDPVGPSCRIKHTADSLGTVHVTPAAGSIDGQPGWTLTPGQAIELDSDGDTLAVF